MKKRQTLCALMYLRFCIFRSRRHFGAISITNEILSTAATKKLLALHILYIYSPYICTLKLLLPFVLHFNQRRHPPSAVFFGSRTDTIANQSDKSNDAVWMEQVI